MWILVGKMTAVAVKSTKLMEYSADPVNPSYLSLTEEKNEPTSCNRMDDEDGA